MTFITKRTIVCNGCGNEGPTLTKKGTATPPSATEVRKAAEAAGWSTGKYVNTSPGWRGGAMKRDFCPRCPVPKTGPRVTDAER